jgi:hypothetical protein
LSRVYHRGDHFGWLLPSPSGQWCDFHGDGGNTLQGLPTRVPAIQPKSVQDATGQTLGQGGRDHLVKRRINSSRAVRQPAGNPSSLEQIAVVASAMSIGAATGYRSRSHHGEPFAVVRDIHEAESADTVAPPDCLEFILAEVATSRAPLPQRRFFYYFCYGSLDEYDAWQKPDLSPGGFST